MDPSLTIAGSLSPLPCFSARLHRLVDLLLGPCHLGRPHEQLAVFELSTQA